MPSLKALAQDLVPNLPRKGSLIPAKVDTLKGMIVHHETAESVWQLCQRRLMSQDSVGYHYVIEDSGLICRTLEEEFRGHHDYYQRGDDIRKFPNQDPLYYDDYYLGLALLGSADHEVNRKQVESLVQLAQAFLAADPKFQLLGHKEVPGKGHSSCPGELFSMEYVRAEARRRIAAPVEAVKWMDSYATTKDAAMKTKALLDSRETVLHRARERVRESTLSLRAAVNLMVELDLELTKELDK